MADSKIHSRDDAIRECARILEAWSDCYVVVCRGRDQNVPGPLDDTYGNTMAIGGDPVLCREICKEATVGLQVATGEVEFELDEEDD
jgi:hypothetical protein